MLRARLGATATRAPRPRATHAPARCQTAATRLPAPGAWRPHAAPSWPGCRPEPGSSAPGWGPPWPSLRGAGRPPARATVPLRRPVRLPARGSARRCAAPTALRATAPAVERPAPRHPRRVPTVPAWPAPRPAARRAGSAAGAQCAHPRQRLRAGSRCPSARWQWHPATPAAWLLPASPRGGAARDAAIGARGRGRWLWQ